MRNLLEQWGRLAFATLLAITNLDPPLKEHAFSCFLLLSKEHGGSIALNKGCKLLQFLYSRFDPRQARHPRQCLAAQGPMRFSALAAAVGTCVESDIICVLVS